VIGLLSVGVVFAVVWYRWERHVPEPVVDLAVSTRSPVLVAHFGGVVAGVSSFSQYIIVFTLVSLPASTGHGLGRSLGVAGLVQLPGVVVLAISILVASRVIAHAGALPVLVAGGLVIAAGFLLGAVRHGSIGELVVSVVIVNAGLGPLFCALPILILHSVDVSETSAVNAVNALSRLTGSVVASALAASILATGTVVVAGVEYPAEWTFVAVYLLAGVVALTMVAAAAHARNVDRSGKTAL
jgi:MFS family permease